MSRGLIGESPCYTPFSTQMSSAILSIASFVKEQNKQNDFAAAASFVMEQNKQNDDAAAASYAASYQRHMALTSSYLHPIVDIPSFKPTSVGVDLSSTIEKAKWSPSTSLSYEQKQRLKLDPSFRLDVESGMTSWQREELKKALKPLWSPSISLSYEQMERLKYDPLFRLDVENGMTSWQREELKKDLKPLW